MSMYFFWKFSFTDEEHQYTTSLSDNKNRTFKYA